MATDVRPPIVYPSRDGKRTADNTLQFRWIVTIVGNLMGLFRDAADVFVAGDLLWYLVEGEPGINAAPDVLVAFGRPKGDRLSYRQWEEGGIAPQVVFEILFQSNDEWELADKFDFYTEHGVEEYYIYEPQRIRLRGYARRGTALRRIAPVRGWVSPRLGVRFEFGTELELYGPNDRRFATYEEILLQRDRAEERAERAEQRIAALREWMRANGIDPDAAPPG